MRLTLCEYATSHNDGTFTLLRGGIEHWTTNEFPVNVVLWLFVEFPRDALPTGAHKLTVDIRGPEPEETPAPTVEVVMIIQNPNKTIRVPVPIQARLPRYGTYRVECSAGGSSAVTTLLVKPIAT